MNRTANKRIAALMIVISLALPLSGVNAAATSGNSSMNGMKMKEMGVSLRTTAEMKGYLVTWNTMNKSITLMQRKDMKMSDETMTGNDMMPQDMDMPTIVLTIGSMKAMVGDKEIMLDIEPYLDMGVAMVSQQFVDTYLMPMM